MLRSLRFFVLGILVAFSVSVPSVFAFTVPESDGFIVDQAGVLTSEDERRLERDFAAYDRRKNTVFAVLLVKTIGRDSALNVARTVQKSWKLEGDYVVIVTAVEDHRIGILASDTLQTTLSESVIRRALERSFLPELAKGHHGRAIRNGTRAIKITLARSGVMSE